MDYIKITFGILIALSVSRFVPHPPNFTSLLAFSFYVPAILGIKFIPALLFSFIITDYIIGFHSVTFFTWGSIVLIGLFSVNFKKNMSLRISGSLLGAVIFYVLTNFGVWSLGSYGYDLNGLITCYTLALPFFGYSLISTLMFSATIEALLKLKLKVKKNKIV